MIGEARKSTAIAETYRTGRVDHMITLAGPKPTAGIPSDIDDDFVVDP